MVKKMRPDYPYGQRSIGAQNGYSDLTSEGVNNQDEILETMHERSTKKMGKTKGQAHKPTYGSDRGEDNEKYSSRRDGNIIYSGSGETPDERKLKSQALPNTRMYTYLE